MPRSSVIATRERGRKAIAEYLTERELDRPEKMMYAIKELFAKEHFYE